MVDEQTKADETKLAIGVEILSEQIHNLMAAQLHAMVKDGAITKRYADKVKARVVPYDYIPDSAKEEFRRIALYFIGVVYTTTIDNIMTEESLKDWRDIVREYGGGEVSMDIRTRAKAH